MNTKQTGTHPTPTNRNSRFLDTRGAANYLSTGTQKLQNMRCNGDGPRYVKYGRGRTAPIRYDVADLDAWVEAQKRLSTSDQGEAA
jgi:hypothetical protein